MNSTQHIPCPICATPIPFDAQGLIEGKAFECPNVACGTKVEIPQERISTVENAFNQLEQLKNQSLKGLGGEE